VLLRHTIDTTHLLLLTKLLRVIRRLATTRLDQTMLPRRIVPTFDRALVGVALRALQEELLPLAAAEPADRTSITTHLLPSSPLTSHCPVGFIPPRRSGRFTPRRLT